MSSTNVVSRIGSSPIYGKKSSDRHLVVTNDLQEILAEPLAWEKFAGNTILITGANGMIPSYLVEALLFLNEDGLNPPCKVLALVRNREKTEERFYHYYSRLDLSIIESDLNREIVIEEPIHLISDTP